MSAEVLREAAEAIRDECYGVRRAFGADERFKVAVADWLTYVADTHDETPCPAMSAAEQVARAYLGGVR